VLGLIENMAGMFPGPGGESLAREAGVPFLGRVPFDPALASAADRGEPYVAVAPEAPAAKALSAIAARLGDVLVTGHP
jgi:Flp pilus assembly CpaE family ATPase